MSELQLLISTALERITKKSVHQAHSSPVVVLRIDSYPDEGVATFVTAGLSPYLYSMWRGKTCGFELTLSVEDSGSEDWARDLSLTAAASIEARKSGERRPAIEYNGVYAPGYPPHLLFCQELSQTPDLVGRRKVGDAYIEWLPAIPILDSEVRMYDRSVPSLIEYLASQPSLSRWPRQ